jgi:hypothetical protein
MTNPDSKSFNCGIKAVTFPPSLNTAEHPQGNVECESSIVVVGANGAGKSRLGSWLEKTGPQRAQVHRITAQRSLVFPSNASPIGLGMAKDAFYWGERPANWSDETWEQNKAERRLQTRYGNNLAHWENSPLNDFEKLVRLLFSENYTQLLGHEEAQRSSAALVPMPDTLVRKVQSLWQSLLPHRILKYTSAEVRVVPVAGGGEYAAQGLSDGERVIFYLIGQCLCAPADAIIVVDEPELHLHKAIQNALWDALEKARQDCVFVYLTHDLTFASDRSGATKVCLEEYSEKGFAWFTVPPQQDIPEDIYLEVLGSRKPVLFAEGTQGSHDLEIYQMAYPDFTVKPLGGCSAVLQATKAFRQVQGLHHIECIGIVDRDYLEEGQIRAYECAAVYTPAVAEVENLFLIPSILEAVAKQLLLDHNAVVANVKQWIIDEFGRAKEKHARELMHHRVSLALGRFSSPSTGIEEYAKEFDHFVKSIDPKAIYDAALKEAERLIAEKDYERILRVFNQKSLVETVDRFFDLKKPSTYLDKVKLMAKQGVGDVPGKLKAYLPDFAAGKPPLPTAVIVPLLKTA